MSVIVHSVHNNIVPHNATPCGLFGCALRPMAAIAVPGTAVAFRALLSCVSRARAGLSKHGPGVEPLFCRSIDEHCRSVAHECLGQRTLPFGPYFIWDPID